MDAFKEFGLKFEQCDNEGNYIAVINDKKVQGELIGNTKLYSDFNLGKNAEVNVTTSSSDKNMTGLTFSGKEYSNKYNGLNIVVYDKVIKQVVDSIYVESNGVIKR